MNIFPFRKRTSTAAAEWLVKIQQGNVDQEMNRAWMEWMSADPRNQEAYERAELVWELSQEVRGRPALTELLDDLDHDVARISGQRLQPPATRRISWPIGVAAACILSLAVGVSIYFGSDHTTSREYSTAIGQQQTVTLDDNSVVTLNTATRLRVAYSRRLRLVELLAGEASFAVQKNKSRPFVVDAQRGRATALGTEFAVQIKPMTTDVLVLDGTVKVQSVDGHDERHTALISAGQAVQYTHEGDLLTVQKPDPDRIRAWQSHRLVFSDVPLADAVQEYNRYIVTPVVIADPALGMRHVNGVFKIGDEPAFLGALQKGLKAKVSVTATAILVEPE